MTRAAKGSSLRQCLMSFLSTPSKLVRSTLTSLPARLVFLVYFGTYATANLFDSLIEASICGDASAISSTIKFGAVTTISTGLTIFKDARMAKYFGSSQLRKIPMSTYGLFALRDAMTIYASFILPGVVSSSVNRSPLMQKLTSDFGMATEGSIHKTAQFALPAMSQLFTTPVHLLGLNYFNRPTGTPFSARIRHVARDLTMAIPIRVVRIIPAFGVGGVINSSTRQSFNNNQQVLL